MRSEQRSLLWKANSCSSFAVDSPVSLGNLLSFSVALSAEDSTLLTGQKVGLEPKTFLNFSPLRRTSDPVSYLTTSG